MYFRRRFPEGSSLDRFSGVQEKRDQGQSCVSHKLYLVYNSLRVIYQHTIFTATASKICSMVCHVHASHLVLSFHVIIMPEIFHMSTVIKCTCSHEIVICSVV